MDFMEESERFTTKMRYRRGNASGQHKACCGIVGTKLVASINVHDLAVKKSLNLRLESLGK